MLIKLLKLLRPQPQLRAYLLSQSHGSLFGEVHVSGRLAQAGQEGSLLSEIALQMMPPQSCVHIAAYCSQEAARQLEARGHALEAPNSSQLTNWPGVGEIREFLWTCPPDKAASIQQLVNRLLRLFHSERVELIGMLCESPQAGCVDDQTLVQDIFDRFARPQSAPGIRDMRELAETDPRIHFLAAKEFSTLIYAAYDEPYLWFDLKNWTMEQLHLLLTRSSSQQGVSFRGVTITAQARRKSPSPT